MCSVFFTQSCETPPRLNIMCQGLHSKHSESVLLAAGWWRATNYRKTAQLQYLYQDCPLFWVRGLPMRSEIVTRCSNFHTCSLTPGAVKGWTEFELILSHPSWSYWLSQVKETCYLQLYYIYRVLQLVTGGTLGFHNRALAHTSSCRFMSGNNYTKCPFLRMIKCFSLFS